MLTLQVTHNHINDADRHREQRRDQQLFQPSGQSNKSSSMTQKKLRFVDNVEEKKYVNSGFPVQGACRTVARNFLVGGFGFVRGGGLTF